MKIRPVVAGVVVAASIAAGTAGAALAVEGERAAGEPTPEQIARRCERGAHHLERLQRIAERLAGRIGAIEERLAGGELTEEQEARAQARLERLEGRQAKLAERIARLEAKLAEKCAA